MTNRELINAVNQAFADNDAESLLALSTDSLTWTMVGDRILAGKGAILEEMKRMPFAEKPKMSHEGLIVEEDQVASMGTMEAVKGDGTPVKLSYCDIYTIEDGKLSAIRSYAIPV